MRRRSLAVLTGLALALPGPAVPAGTAPVRACDPACRCIERGTAEPDARFHFRKRPSSCCRPIVPAGRITAASARPTPNAWPSNAAATANLLDRSGSNWRPPIRRREEGVRGRS